MLLSFSIIYFLVAIAPKILYPEYPDSGPVESEDFSGFSRYITVHLRYKITYKTLELPCYVKDFKAHSYNQYPDGHPNVLTKNKKGKVIIPNGLIQTGIAYPNSDNAKKIGHAIKIV